MTTAIEREQGGDPARPHRFDRQNAEARTGQWLLEVDRAWLALRHGSAGPEAAQVPEPAEPGAGAASTQRADADFLRPQDTTNLERGQETDPAPAPHGGPDYIVRDTNIAPRADMYATVDGTSTPADRVVVPNQQATAPVTTPQSTGNQQPDLTSQNASATPLSSLPAAPGANHAASTSPSMASPSIGSQTNNTPAPARMQGLLSHLSTTLRTAGTTDRSNATPTRPTSVMNSPAGHVQKPFVAASALERGIAVNPPSMVTVAGISVARATDPHGLTSLLGESASAADAEPMPEPGPLDGAPPAGEAYSTRHVHVHVDDDGVHAYLRDANLDRTDVFAIAQTIYGQTMLDQANLASVTVNGTFIPMATRLERKESASLDSRDEDDVSPTSEFRAQRSITL